MRANIVAHIDDTFGFKNGKVGRTGFHMGSGKCTSLHEEVYVRQFAWNPWEGEAQCICASCRFFRILQLLLVVRCIIPLSCVYPTNHWGKSFEDFIKEVKKQVNPGNEDDDSVHKGQVDRARMRIHWLRGRLEQMLLDSISKRCLIGSAMQ